MGKLSDALGFGAKGASEEMPPSIPEDVDAMDEMVEKPSMGGSAEVLAMKQFKRATTPEAMAAALKDFGEACGWTTGDY